MSLHGTRRAILKKPARAPFVPSNIAGLKVWCEADFGVFQASDGTTASGNGDVVGYWTDKSGSGNHVIQTTTSLKPTYQTTAGPGSKQTIEFDGIDDYLQKVFALSQPATVFLVAQQVTWTNPDHFLDGGTFAAMSLLQIILTPRIQLFAGFLGPLTTDLTLGNFGIVTALYSGAASMIRVNAGSKVVADAGATAPGGVTIGSRQTGADASNIRVSAVLVYNRDLSASGEDAAVIGYLNSKWGVF